MLCCPVCSEELNMDAAYEDGPETYTDYSCQCGVTVTVPWGMNEEEGNEDHETLPAEEGSEVEREVRKDS